MATKPRKTRQTAEDRKAKVDALRDRLEDWQEDQDTPGLAAVFAMHDGYSERNAMLIAMQMPEATDVSGFRAWQDRGRSVKEGEHGIQILAPAGKRDAVEANEAEGIEGQAARQFFRIAYVFDYSQTEPLEVARARWAARTAETMAAIDAREAAEDAADQAAYEAEQAAAQDQAVREPVSA